MSVPAPTPAPGAPDDVLNFVSDGSQLVVPLALGEPPTLIRALEDNAARFRYQTDQ